MLSLFKDMELNCDSFKIRNYEKTPEGFLKMWLVGGVPDLQLDYEGRLSEVINEDGLFNQDSLDTAVGKPICYNHPPRAITSENYKEFIHGSILQEFAKEPETNALVMSSIVYDSVIADKIMRGELKYVSAGYKAMKELNQDGVLVQKKRHYNHFAIISPEYEPRAGKASRIIVIDDGNNDSIEPPQTPPTDVVTPSEGVPPEAPTIPVTPPPTQPVETSEPQTPVTEPGEPVETSESEENMDSITVKKDEIAKRVELLTQFKGVLEKAGKAVDFNADSRHIKKDILSVYYKDNVLKQIDDTNLDGFWLGFIASNNDVKDVIGETRVPLTGVDNLDSTSSFESVLEAQITEFTKKLEGVK